MHVHQRNISQSWTVEIKPGGGPHLRVGQVLPPGNWKAFDPFLMMAEDWFQQGTFDFHPHRGMETVTYVIDGKLKHEDNHGGYGILEAGDVQWMTAGKGIIHSEDPLPDETVHSLQLWLNLPREQKMSSPRYQDIKASHVAVREEPGVRIRVFSGASDQVTSETLNHVPVTYLELVLQPGVSVVQDLPGSYNGFLYILEGSGYFGSEHTPGEKQQVLWLGASDMSQSEILIQAGTNESLKVLLIAGEPLGEPVASGGPFVMNTEEEIQQAFKDFHAGKFDL